MKKCPKCKAEIQEEARFCLYCMTSFEEKQTIETPKENNKRWLIIIAAVLVLVFIVACIFLFTQKDSQVNVEIDTSSTSFISSDLDTFDDNNTTSSEQQNSESQGNETSTPTSSNQTQTSSKNEGNTTNNTSGNTTTNNSSSGTSTNNTTTSASSQNSTTSNNKTTNSTSTNFSSSSNKTENNNSGSSSTTTTTPSEIPTVTYIYRDAKYGDDYFVGTNLDNSVVITGVKTASTNGEYKIPDTIDGKKVIAIMSGAFCDEDIRNTVKKVIVPSTVKTIWNGAFAKCYNLNDIYFCGNSIYTESQAFPESSKRKGAITIHCSANCSDREFRTYKNYITNYLNDTLNDYSILYEEWNYEG